MDSSSLAGIIVGSIVGLFALALTLHYSVYLRLPYWVSNLLQFPPVLSFKNQLIRPPESCNTLIVVALSPLVLVIVFLIAVVIDTIVTEPPGISDMQSLVDCSAEIAKEEIALAIHASGNITNIYVRELATDSACGPWLTDEMTIARELKHTLTDLMRHMSVVRSLLDTKMLSLALTFLKKRDALEFSFLNAQLLEHSAREYCESIDAAHEGIGSLFRWDRTSTDIIKTLEAMSMGESNVFLESSHALADDKLLQNVSKEISKSFIPIMYRDKLYENITEQNIDMMNSIRRFHRAITSDSVSELDDAITYAHKEKALYLGLLLPAIFVTALSFIACAFLLARRIKGMAVLSAVKKDFDDSEEARQKIAALQNSLEKLRIENLQFDDTLVQQCYRGLADYLKVLKPFISHSLYECEEESSGTANASVSGSNEFTAFDLGQGSSYGNIHLNPLKLQVGMRHVNASFLVLSNEMFNDLPSQDMHDRCEDFVDDYNTLIDIVLTNVSSLGGVIHDIGSGTITCTWNCSTACPDKHSERAVNAAFRLTKDFADASRTEKFVMIPDENAVCVFYAHSF